MDKDKILELYQQGNSVWTVGKILGISGQTVHKHLVKMGLNRSINSISIEDLELIKQLYENGFKTGDGSLQKLSKQLNRTVPFISRQAKKMGLTSYNRKLSDSSIFTISKNTLKMIEEKGHPRGALGMKHTDTAKSKISKASKINHKNMSAEKRISKVTKMIKTKIDRGNLFVPRPQATWKAGWRDIGGKRMYLRSHWEEVYAKYLEDLKESKKILEWEYEAVTFWFDKIKRGCRSYTPDFKVTCLDETIEFHEVKGWMDSRSITKLNRMRIYHPKVKMVLIDSKTYKSMFGNK